jgi:hypothetical protein
LLDERAVALAAEALAGIGRAAVLPDDGVIDGYASVTIPHDRGLALIRDADRGNVAWPGIRFRESFQRYGDLRGSDLLWIVLDPAGLRKDLIEFTLSDRANRSAFVE